MNKVIKELSEKIINEHLTRINSIKDDYIKEFMNFIGEPDPYKVAEKYLIVVHDNNSFRLAIREIVTEYWFCLKSDREFKPVKGFHKLKIITNYKSEFPEIF